MGDTMKDILAGSLLGELQTNAVKNANHRLFLLEFAESLRTAFADFPTTWGGRRTDAWIRNRLGIDALKVVDADAFVNMFQKSTNMPELSLRRIFEILDYTDRGFLIVESILSEITAIAPGIDEATAIWFQDLHANVGEGKFVPSASAASNASADLLLNLRGLRNCSNGHEPNTRISRL